MSRELSWKRWKLLGTMGLLLLLGGCKAPDHDHSEGGHDHGGGGHDAEHAVELEPLAVTAFTDKTELFVEFPPLVVGKASKFAAHITRLSDYAPNRQGRLVVRIDGPTRQEVSADAPKRPGIYGPELVPTQPGQYRMTIEVSGPELTDTIEVGEVTVYPNVQAVPAPEASTGPEPVTFLKEQAWRIPFRTELVSAGELPATVQAFGRLEAVPGQNAKISAPVSGILAPAGSSGFPLAGQPVSKKQVLAHLLPGPAEGQDFASLEREKRQAQAKLETAKAALERLTKLAGEQAAAPREVEEARALVVGLEAELRATSTRLGTLGGTGEGSGISLVAPISGRITAVRVGGQQRVAAGETLFEIAEASALRLRVDVSEVDLPRLNGVSDAWLTLPGESVPQRVSALGGKLLSVGGAVDPNTRTVTVWFEVPNPEGKLFSGTAVQVQLLTRTLPAPTLEPSLSGADSSGAATGVIVPSLAVVDDNGQSIVYVQIEGEAFERREVIVGARVGDQVHIIRGVNPGERVVTRGGYEIRLASLSGSGFGAGHSH